MRMNAEAGAASDSDLVRLARAGDFGAFEQLVERHERAVYSLARRMLQSEQDAEDITQQTFISALQHLRDFREEGAFGGWLMRIATHAALKVLRRFDTPQAISTLMLMLADQDPEGRAAAMSCLIYFDFALVRLPLTELLQANPQDELLREALCLFASNPDPENLYSLYVLERTMASSAVAKIRTVRQQCEQILIAYGRLDPNGAVQREQDFSGRWQAEQARKAAPPPPYSVKKLRPGAMPVPAVAASESDEGWTGKVASFGRDLLKRLTE